MHLRAIGNRIRDDFRYFGIRKTVYDLFFRAVNRFTFFKIFRIICLENVHPKYQIVEPPFEWGLLDKSQLEKLTRCPDYDITEDFLASAIERGDQCYGIRDGRVMASYAWYSRQPTQTSDDLTVYFSSEYVYMYKGFTHPQYRGQRLYAIGLNLAMREYLARGYKGLVLYVESNNFSSLKSVQRLGYQRIGCVTVWKPFGWPIIHTGGGCRKFGLFLRPTKRTGQTVIAADHLETVTHS
jgi:ribosomal protein S18 acetylase RimI-like enzyme